jgi:hypothetical protein
MNQYLTAIMVGLSASLVSGVALAQAAGQAQAGGNSSPISIINEAAKDSSNFNFSYGPPSSPALDLLGLSNSKNTPSSSLAPFLFSLLPAVDGQSGQYAGIDVSLLGIGSAFSKGMDKLHQAGEVIRTESFDPEANLGTQLWLARTRLDFGITNGQSNSDVTKEQLSGVAFGISSALLPLDDPRLVSGIHDARGTTYFRYCVAPLIPQEAANEAALQAKDETAKLGDILRRRAQLIADALAVGASKTTDAVAQLSRDISDFEKTYPSVRPKKETIAKIAGQPVQYYGASGAAIWDIFERLDAAEDSENKTYVSDALQLAQAGGIPAKIASCAKGATAIASSQPDLTVGIGEREMGTPGSFKNLGSPGGTAWMGWRFPIIGPTVLADSGNIRLADVTNAKQDQLDAINSGKLNYVLAGGSIRLDENDRFLTGNTTTPVIQADEFDAWGGLQWNTGTFYLGAQGGYSRVWATQVANKSFDQSGARWLVQGDYRIGTTGAWVGVSYGNSNGTTTKLHDKTFLVNLYFSPPSALALFGKPG